MRHVRLPDAGVRPDLLVVGDVMLDRILEGDAARLSVEAPVPIVHLAAEHGRPGGAANVAANLAALGARVTLLGAVGEDDEAESLEQAARDAGVSEVRLLRRPDAPTTVKTRLVARRQQVARVDRERALPLAGPVQADLIGLLPGLVAGRQAVLVPDYGKGLITPAVWKALAAACRSAGLPLLVDPSPRAAAGDYPGAGILKPNWSEARQAVLRTGEEDPDIDEVGGRWLEAAGDAGVLVTRGDRGMSLFRAGLPRFDAPAQRRDVYDVTGAGDTVLATLGWALAAGQPVEDAVLLANLAGGLAVERFGTAAISRSDLDHALAPEAALESKVIGRAELDTFLAPHRQAGRSVVFTNGCFDILHPGHLRLLRRCAAFGDVVVVGINSDDSVRRLKGPERPVLQESDRALVLAALREVDAVVVFDEDTPAEVIREIRPQVLVKGGDYRPEDVVGRDEVEAAGGRLELIPLREGSSTSRLVDRIKRGRDAAGADKEKP